MKGPPLAIALGLCLVGCNPQINQTPNNTTPPFGVTKSASAPATRHGGGAVPMASGAAGGITPMVGTDSVEGVGGGGVAQAAKKMAKDKAVKAGGGSLDQMPKDDSGQ